MYKLHDARCPLLAHWDPARPLGRCSPTLGSGAACSGALLLPPARGSPRSGAWPPCPCSRARQPETQTDNGGTSATRPSLGGTRFSPGRRAVSLRRAARRGRRRKPGSSEADDACDGMHAGSPPSAGGGARRSGSPPSDRAFGLQRRSAAGGSPPASLRLTQQSSSDGSQANGSPLRAPQRHRAPRTGSVFVTNSRQWRLTPFPDGSALYVWGANLGNWRCPAGAQLRVEGRDPVPPLVGRPERCGEDCIEVD